MQDLPENTDAVQLREAFLHQMSDRLRAHMSPFEIDDTVREVRSHLVAASAAFEELGLAPVDAMQSAIRSFGQTAQIERGLAEESRKVAIGSSTIVTAGLGAVVGAALFPAADASLVWAHLVSNPSEGMAGIGLVVGALIGFSLSRRPRGLFVGALRAAIVVPLCLLTFVCAVNRGWPGTAFFFATILAFGTASFFAALFTQMLAKIFARRSVVRRPSLPG